MIRRHNLSVGTRLVTKREVSSAFRITGGPREAALPVNSLLIVVSDHPGIIRARDEAENLWNVICLEVRIISPLEELAMAAE